MRPLSISSNFKQGSWDLLKAGKVILKNINCGIVLSDGTRILSKQYPEHKVEDNNSKDKREIKIIHSGVKELPIIIQRIVIAKDSPAIQIDVRINAVRKYVKIERIEVLTTSLSNSALFENEKIWLFRHGTAMPSDDVGFYPVNRSVKERWVSKKGKEAIFCAETFAVFKSETEKNMLSVGFISLAHQATRIYISTEKANLTAISYLEGYDLLPGEIKSSETLHIETGNELNKLLNSWVENTAKIMRARVPKSIPSGWSDWQYYRGCKTEKHILENVDVLSQMKKRGYPLEYVVIDGGYAPYDSEWLETKESFPHGMKWLAERIRKKGLKFGVWFAPYTTNVNTKVAKEHPEWMVMEEKTGEPLYCAGSNVGPCCVLDFTVSEALEWLRDIMRVMVKEWGCEWLKLDGPALRYYEGGRFHNPNTTTVEQVRKSMEVIREEAGNIIVEGEGYYGPSIGLVDIQRVQQDNHPDWRKVKRHWANDLMSNFMHGHFWGNHRENVILRDNPSPFYHQKRTNPEAVEPLLTENELQFHITSAFLTGGPMLLTDPLKYLMANKKRSRLISKFLPHYGKAARIVDGFTGKREAEIFVLDVDALGEKYKIVGIFNFQDEYRDFKMSFRRLGLDDSKEYHVFEYWTESYNMVKKILKVDNVPPHACRLLAIRKVKNHPQILSTSLHLSQGAVDLKKVSYIKDKKRLRIVCGHFIQDNEKIFVHVPKGFVLKDVKTNATSHLVDQRIQGLLVVHFSGKRETEFDILFK